MVTTAARGDGDLPPPGLFCPCCRGNELQLLGDHGRAEPACVGCGLFVRLLRHHGDPTTRVGESRTPAACCL